MENQHEALSQASQLQLLEVHRLINRAEQLKDESLRVWEDLSAAIVTLRRLDSEPPLDGNGMS